MVNPINFSLWLSKLLFFGSLNVGFVGSLEGHATIFSQNFSSLSKCTTHKNKHSKIGDHIGWSSRFYCIWRIEICIIMKRINGYIRLRKKMVLEVHWNLKGCHSQETKPWNNLGMHYIHKCSSMNAQVCTTNKNVWIWTLKYAW